MCEVEVHDVFDLVAVARLIDELGSESPEAVGV